MSLKYRLIILATAVFAAAFGGGTLLGVRGARRLAEAQLQSRLARSAAALAASGAPLNDEALARIAPVLDAQIMVLDKQGQLLARSGADWQWPGLRGWFASALASTLPVMQQPVPKPPWPEIDGQRFYFGLGEGRSAATGQQVTVIVLADQEAVRQPTRTILLDYLVILCITAALLAGGMYFVGWFLVRRIARLNRVMDATLSEAPLARRRRGDELRRLQDAFDDMLERLNVSRQRLAAQQRLATAGKIASSLAHELRNPLQAIRLTVQMLRAQCPAEGRPGCDLILGELDRLNLLTDELLVLAGKDALRVERVDLARELHETLRLMQFQLRQREISAAADLPALPAVAMDRNRCRQLLLNLLLNAVEASPGGGTVRVQGSTVEGGVVIRIADNGPGFPQEVLQDRAEEFFSTKTTGAGLGLSICRRIVEEAGGRVSLYNTPAGAVAEVVLPVEKTG